MPENPTEKAIIPKPTLLSEKKWTTGRILNIFGPFLGLILVFTLFSFLVPEHFPTAYNLSTVASQTVIVALAAMGMTLIIISGGIDLSVGSVIALSTVVTALSLDSGNSPLFSLFMGVLSGVIAGFINGLFITVLRLVPFIATLGMYGIARGFAKYLAKEQKVDAPMTWLAEVMAKTPIYKWMIISPGVWLMIISAIVVALALKYSVLGRHIFAVGSNERAARLCGVNVRRTKIYIYSIAGFFTGLAGVMQFSRLTVGDPTVAMGKELDVIAAVVIGGGSLSGGEGSVLGSLIGAFIMAFLRNGCNMVGLPNYFQEIIIGIIIITAVALDRLRHRRSD